MADTPYSADHTRTWWADADADRDIHLEAYEGEIEGSFRVNSLFRSLNLTNFKSVQNQTNAYRFDRIGGVTVRGRKPGTTLDASRIVNDKAIITVDTTSYIRTVYDYQDDWTSPDFQAEYVQEHGTAHAKAFDQAHLIKLIHAGDWVAPADLKASGAFQDGISKELTGFAAASTKKDKANILVDYHQELVETFIKRDLGGSLGEFVNLISPEWFTILLNHDKLMNVEFQGGDNGNSFTQRRIGWMNGQRLIETPRFPGAEITNHYLGPQFNVSTTQARSGLVMFHPRKTLLTVEAHPMAVRQFDMDKDWESYLDSFNMYTVGIRRGDACGVLRADG